MRRKKQHIPIL